MLFAAGTVRDLPVRALRLCGLTWSGQFLWYSEAVTHEITAVDPFNGEVLHTLTCPAVGTDLTTVGGQLLQVVGPEHRLRLLDPNTGFVLAERPNPRPGHELHGIEAGRDGLWLGYADLGVLELRERDTLRLLDSIPVRGEITGVTVSDRYLAYSDANTSLITLVDPQRRTEVASVWVNGNPAGITWDGSWVWYCDRATLQLRAIEVPGIIGTD